MSHFIAECKVGLAVGRGDGYSTIVVDVVVVVVVDDRLFFLFFFRRRRVVDVSLSVVVYSSSSESVVSMPNVVSVSLSSVVSTVEVVGEPVVGSDVVGEPVVGSAVVGESVVGSAVVGAPVVGSAVVGESVVGSAVVGASVVGSGVGRGVGYEHSEQKSVAHSPCALPSHRSSTHWSSRRKRQLPLARQQSSVVYAVQSVVTGQVGDAVGSGVVGSAVVGCEVVG